MMLAAFGPLVMMFQYSQFPEEIELPTLPKFILPILGAFAMGALVSLTLVRRFTLPLIQKIKNQFLTLGYVEDNQGPLFSNFGFNLFSGVIFGLATIGDYLCYELSMEDVTISLSYFSWNLLRCQAWNYSISAFIAGIGIVGFLWLFFQVRRVEKETNQIIFVHYYKPVWTAFWIIPLTVVVVGILGYTFFQIFTLGAR